MNSASFALVLGMLLLSTSCGSNDQCGAACGPPLTIELRNRGDAPFPEGTYTIVLTGGIAGAVRCTLEARAAATCTGGGTGLRVGYGSNAFLVFAQATPSSVHVELQQGTTKLLSSDLSPTYSEGNVCGDTCTFARVTAVAQ